MSLFIPTLVWILNATNIVTKQFGIFVFKSLRVLNKGFAVTLENDSVYTYSKAFVKFLNLGYPKGYVFLQTNF